MTGKFYDAHIHFYFNFPSEGLRPVFNRLSEAGLAGFSALTIVEFPQDMEKVLKMIPAALHDCISLSALEAQRDPLPYLNWARPITIIPIVDTRYMESGFEEKLAGFKERGFRGIKILYVPEEDGTIGMEGMERAFGWSLKKSEDIAARLVAGAAAQGMSVLFHVDLRRYGDFVKELIRSHPVTNFNIPHFGFSRKSLAGLLETYPNCYTDSSFLVSFMEEAPLSYQSFIRRYQEKILYGSDALMDEPERIESCHKFVERLVDDREVFRKLTCENYLAFQAI